jgi:hypothetical protein
MFRLIHFTQVCGRSESQRSWEAGTVKQRCQSTGKLEKDQQAVLVVRLRSKIKILEEVVLAST